MPHAATYSEQLSALLSAIFPGSHWAPEAREREDLQRTHLAPRRASIHEQIGTVRYGRYLHRCWVQTHLRITQFRDRTLDTPWPKWKSSARRAYSLLSRRAPLE